MKAQCCRCGRVLRAEALGERTGRIARHRTSSGEWCVGHREAHLLVDATKGRDPKAPALIVGGGPRESNPGVPGL